MTSKVLHLSLLYAGLAEADENSLWPILALEALFEGEFGALGLGPFLKLRTPTFGTSSLSLASPWRSPDEKRRRRKFIPEPKESRKFENEILAVVAAKIWQTEYGM